MARILAIDDEANIRDLLSIVLSEAGHEVVTACDGQDGLRRAAVQPFDLVITDIVMPEKEGIETIQELRQKSAGVKIIAISGGGRISPEEYLDWARRFGVHCTFTKPIDRDDLLRTVAGLTGAKTA